MGINTTTGATKSPSTRKKRKQKKTKSNNLSPGRKPSIQSTNDAPMIHSETVSTEWSSAATATGGQTRQKKSLPQKNSDLASARRTARTAAAAAMEDIAFFVWDATGKKRTMDQASFNEGEETKRKRERRQRARAEKKMFSEA